MLRVALLILSGNAATSLFLLIRNLLIARMIPMADYGIAATFAVTMAAVEMMSALGLQQQIVQAKEGDNRRFQAGLQGFQVLRGVIAALILFALAEYIAAFLREPEVAWAYRVMALVPIFNALQHFDIHRLNRQMRFWPLALTGAVPALVSVVAVWPLYLWFGDYQVMLWAIVLQYGLMMGVSHLVAERPYRLVFDRAIMGQSLKFGWPLLVNGILLFAVFNGDKLIVGRELGMETLAVFAMGITLTLTPTLVMAKSAQNFFLPQLSAIGDPRDPGFIRLAAVTMEVALLMGVLLVAGVLLIGQPVVLFLVGEKYVALLPLIIWFAIVQAVRTFKAGPAIVALAVGHTENAMLANIARLMVLPWAWYVATVSGDLLMILWIGLIGEVIGQGVAMGILIWRTGLAARTFVIPHLAAAAFLMLAVWLGWNVAPSQGVWMPQGWLAFGVCCALLGVVWSASNLRAYVRQRSISRDEAP